MDRIGLAVTLPLQCNPKTSYDMDEKDLTHGLAATQAEPVADAGQQPETDHATAHDGPPVATDGDGAASREDAPDVTDPSADMSRISLADLLGRDVRVGHFIVDVLAGVEPETASRTYFPPDAGEMAGVAAAIEEAEQRGYLRGRNERIAAEMDTPGLWEDCAVTTDAAPAPADDGPLILSGIRRSVWE